MSRRFFMSFTQILEWLEDVDESTKYCATGGWMIMNLLISSKTIESLNPQKSLGIGIIWYDYVLDLPLFQ